MYRFYSDPELACLNHQGLSFRGQVGAKVDSVVELVKDDYLVLSVPAQQHAIVFAATGDFNLGPAQEGRQFSPGQKLSAVVAAEASLENGASIITLCSYMCKVDLYFEEYGEG